jgi:soluble lytic murein transglycosylase
MPKFVLINWAIVFLWAVSNIAYGQTAPNTMPRSSANDEIEIAELIERSKTDSGAFRLNNYDYRLARLAERNGKIALAVENYQSVSSRNSILKAYALFHLSQCFRSMGNLLMERIYLERILVETPNSLLVSVAKVRLARSSNEVENYASAVTYLLSQDGKASTNDDSPRAINYWRDDQVSFGEIRMRQARTVDAQAVFSAVIASTPNADQPDDASRSAARGLDLIAGGKFDVTPIVIGKLTDAEHLQRAKIYQFNRDFALAKAHFEGHIAITTSRESIADSLFQIGRGYSQSSEHVEALKWYERILEQFSDSSFAKDALLQAAAAYARVGKPREALTRYQRYIDKYPTDEKLDRAYLNVVDLLRDQGDLNDALKWTAKTQEIFAGLLPATIALFVESRIHLSLGEWQKALEKLDRLRAIADLGGKTIPGGTDATEVSFLRCFALEKLSRTDEAIECYLSIPDGRDAYYGWRSTLRLAELGTNEAFRPYLLQRTSRSLLALKSKNADEQRRAANDLFRLSTDKEVRSKAIEAYTAAVKQLPSYKLIPELRPTLPAGRAVVAADSKIPRDGATELLFLGLYDEAADQFAADDAANKNETLAVMLKGGNAERSVAATEPLWSKVPADILPEMLPREQLWLLYPMLNRDDLLFYATRHKVDPRLLLAIMRQESRFRTDARSNAAARGLMQFIAPTANKIATSLGRGGFRQEELYSPTTAIEFGSRYIEDLFKLFPEQPQAVVASYNGGEENLKRWVARSGGNDPDLYVAEIIFTQSKDYVYRVMANYRMYCQLYDSELNPLN